MKKTANYNNIATYNINSLPRYSSGFPCGDDSQVICLDGQWDFYFCNTVKQVPQDYHFTDTDTSYFDKIKVPSEWQIEGYDVPIYTNIRYPKAIKTKGKPRINEKLNTVGCYVRHFNFTQTSSGMRVYLQFQGINSSADIYLNGHFVGYSQDTFSPQEYDVTDLIINGENKLAVTVYRYCIGSYLEDQDMWRLSGIFRSVNIIVKPDVEIADGFSYSQIASDFNSAVMVTKLNIANKSKEYFQGEVNITLSYQGEEIFSNSCNCTVAVSQQKSLVVYGHVNNVKLWSHEVPHLYDVTVTLSGQNGQKDIRKWKFGFRKIEVLGQQDGNPPKVLLNGKPVKFFGVNRHEFHPEYGHAVPKEITEQDVLLLKRNNVTAIRTSHYPDSDAFYDICDRLGVLVMSETNLETHGIARKVPADNPMWTEHCIYRAVNMVNRLKNHPSIVSWSLGNEAGYGSSFVAMKKAILAIDNTRFIHYHPDQSAKVGDVLSGMYIKAENLQTIADNKPFRHCRSMWALHGSLYTSDMYKNLPFMQCEYAHAMGNSLGNFSDYWDIYRSSDRFMGGFIWDFADQAIKTMYQDKIRWCYGGDFGDKPNDGRFCFNGIVRGDRSPNPALYEVRYQYQQVWFSLKENNVLAVRNDYMFLNLNQFIIKGQYSIEGKEIGNFEIKPCGNAGSITEYQLPAVNCDEKGELVLNIELITNTETEALPKGHVVAYEQFLLMQYKFERKLPNADINYNRYKQTIEISTKDAKYRVEKGFIVSVNRGGVEYINNAVKPCFFRATIDNDSMPFIPPKLADFLLGIKKFYRAEKTLRAKKTLVQQKDGCVEVTVYWKMRYMKNLITVYRFGAQGAVELIMKVKSSQDLERYGFTFESTEQQNSVAVYGKSKWENYCDRATGAKLALTRGEISNFVHDYLYPQENGNRTAVRYAEIGSGNTGFKVFAVNKAFEFSIHPYTRDMLDKATHSDELTELKNWTVNIDGGQRGVGGDIPAIACIKDKYKLKAKQLHTLDVVLEFGE